MTKTCMILKPYSMADRTAGLPEAVLVDHSPQILHVTLPDVPSSKDSLTSPTSYTQPSNVVSNSYGNLSRNSQRLQFSASVIMHG